MGDDSELPAGDQYTHEVPLYKREVRESEGDEQEMRVKRGL